MKTTGLVLFWLAYFFCAAITLFSCAPFRAPACLPGVEYETLWTHPHLHVSPMINCKWSLE